MATYSRRQEILSYIKEHRRATVSELAKSLYCSEATIRRDLSHLEYQQAVKRVHGAAVIVEDSETTSTSFRETRNAQEKELVAKIASDNLPQFNTAFFDNSSTALVLIKRLDLSNKEIFTNGILAMNQLAQNSKTKIVIPGGQVRYDLNEITGAKVIQDLDEYRFDIAIISCSSIAQDGCFEVSEITSLIKKKVLQNSKYKVLIFDKSKLHKNRPYKVASPNMFDVIVTDASKEEMKEFIDNGCNIICK